MNKKFSRSAFLLSNNNISSKIIFLTFIAISVLALIVRLYALSGQDLTVDEPLWMQRGPILIKKWDAPWISKGAALNFPAAVLMGISIINLPFIDHITTARLPIVFLGTFTCSLLFYFLQRQSCFGVAVVASIILALDPVHIGFSRIAGIDVSLTFFMMLSILTYFEGTRTKKLFWFFFSGSLFSMAFMTKPSAAILIFILFTWETLRFLISRSWIRDSFYISLRKILIRIAVWLFSAGLIMLVLWPEGLFYDILFQNSHAFLPLENLINYISATLQNAGTAHVNFFMGSVTANPPLYYYLIIIPIRLPELTLVLLFIGFCFLGFQAFHKRISNFELLIILWIAFYIALMSLLPKKLEVRYVLPIWPAIMIVAASGFLQLISIFKSFMRRFKKYSNSTSKNRSIKISFLLVLFLTLTMMFPLYSFGPNYTLYYNRLVGGPEGAKDVTLVGWGEGHYEAAMYLRNITEDNDWVQVAGYDSLIKYHFPTVNSKYIDEDWRRADFLVVYVNWLQRNPENEVTKYIVDNNPAKTITLSGCQVAWIYDLKTEN